MVIKVKVISWSRSSQGHSHFEVKVILESNGNVFQLLSQNGWLAFVPNAYLFVLKFSCTSCGYTVLYYWCKLNRMHFLCSKMLKYYLDQTQDCSDLVMNRNNERLLFSSLVILSLLLFAKTENIRQKGDYMYLPLMLMVNLMRIQSEH